MNSITLIIKLNYTYRLVYTYHIIHLYLYIPYLKIYLLLQPEKYVCIIGSLLQKVMNNSLSHVGPMFTFLSVHGFMC